MRAGLPFGIFATLLIAGCSGSAHDSASDAESTRVAHTQPESKPPQGTLAPTGRPTDATSLAVGPISLVPPQGWETRETSQPPGCRIFATDRPEWRKAGFRPNLGVTVRPHPGVSLDDYRKELNAILEQSVEQVNATIAQSRIPLAEKTHYSIEMIDVDNVPVLSTMFSGVFQLPSGLIATKTYGLQVLLDTDALYSIALTFPIEAEAEMNPIWRDFVKSLRVSK